MAPPKKEVLGQRFGKWTVTNVAIEQRDHRRRVECTCECGKIAAVRLDNLTRGTSKDCGCSRRDDLVGKRFGKLIVKEFIGTSRQARDQHWLCICDCGKETKTTSDQLRREITKSCGCLSSYVNEQIDAWLREQNIDFKREYRIARCRRKQPLPFDFAVKMAGNLRLIEYQGKQHYEVVNGWGGEVRLRQIQESDQIKFDFCKEHGIPLLCIPYWERDRMFDLIEEFLT